MRYNDKHRMTFVEGRYAYMTQNSLIRALDKWYLMIFNGLGKKNSQTLLSNADREIPTPLGWSGDAMVLGKLPVPRRPTKLDYSTARAHCTCSRYVWGYLDTFLFFLPV